MAGQKTTEVRSLEAIRFLIKGICIKRDYFRLKPGEKTFQCTELWVGLYGGPGGARPGAGEQQGAEHHGGLGESCAAAGVNLKSVQWTSDAVSRAHTINHSNLPSLQSKRSIIIKISPLENQLSVSSVLLLRPPNSPEKEKVAKGHWASTGTRSLWR